MNLKEKYAYVRILQSQYQKVGKKDKGKITTIHPGIIESFGRKERN